MTRINIDGLNTLPRVTGELIMDASSIGSSRVTVCLILTLTDGEKNDVIKSFFKRLHVPQVKIM